MPSAQERIDIRTRTVTSRRPYTAEIGRVVTAVYDSWSDAMVVGYGLRGSSFGTTSGYRVDLVAH